MDWPPDIVILVFELCSFLLMVPFRFLNFVPRTSVSVLISVCFFYACTLFTHPDYLILFVLGVLMWLFFILWIGMLIIIHDIFDLTECGLVVIDVLLRLCFTSCYGFVLCVHRDLIASYFHLIQLPITVLSYATVLFYRFDVLYLSFYCWFLFFYIVCFWLIVRSIMQTITQFREAVDYARPPRVPGSRPYMFD